jgi:MtN3 and saliva related transmembrane protein
MPSTVVDIMGAIGAVLTTICWLPQALKILRERDARAISLPANAAFTLGIACWLCYGLALADWPLIGSSIVTLVLMLAILTLKLRHG